MGLEARLRQLESKVRPANTAPEHHIDLDQCIARTGIGPGRCPRVSPQQG